MTGDARTAADKLEITLDDPPVAHPEGALQRFSFETIRTSRFELGV
jgi:hypothetical protein